MQRDAKDLPAYLAPVECGLFAQEPVGQLAPDRDNMLSQAEQPQLGRGAALEER